MFASSWKASSDSPGIGLATRSKSSQRAKLMSGWRRRQHAKAGIPGPVARLGPTNRPGPQDDRQPQMAARRFFRKPGRGPKSRAVQAFTQPSRDRPADPRENPVAESLGDSRLAAPHLLLNSPASQVELKHSTRAATPTTAGGLNRMIVRILAGSEQHCEGPPEPHERRRGKASQRKMPCPARS